MDCPFYEQLQYAMDSRSEILYTYALSADDRLARQAMEAFRRAQRPDGLLNCDAPTVQSNVIPGFSIFYLLMVHDHMLYFGDKALVRQHLPTIDRILGFFDANLTNLGPVGKVGGTLFHNRHWSFIDWSEKWDTGMPNAGSVGDGSIVMESLLYLCGLQKGAELARFVGRNDQSAEYLLRAEELKAAIRSHAMGIYRGIPMVQDGPGLEEYSVHAQVFAVLTGLVTPEQGRRMAKNLGLDKDGQQKHLGGFDYFTDSLGQFALNSINQLTGQLTYFYTTKLGMAAGTVGTVLLGAKIFDAVSDLFMGKIVDKTNTKDGKARPWLLRMVIPAFLACVLLFTVPASMGSFRYIYALITAVFASAIVYTAIAVPYYTMMSYKTKSSEEKGKMGTWRAAVGYAIGVACGIGLIPITVALGDDQMAWIKFGIILGALSALCLFITYRFSREIYHDEGEMAQKEAKVGILEGVKMLLGNKYHLSSPPSFPALKKEKAALLKEQERLNEERKMLKETMLGMSEAYQAIDEQMRQRKQGTIRRNNDECL